MNEFMQELKVLCDEATIKLNEIRERMSAIDQSLQKSSPQLIQGYTAENWQEIIDCGYLCEAKDKEGSVWSPAVLLRVDGNDTKYPFQIKFSYPDDSSETSDDAWFSHCRPAQIKGVMRPIFVEPVDRNAMCIFYRDSNFAVEGYDDSSGHHYMYSDFVEQMTQRGATKYIEL